MSKEFYAPPQFMINDMVKKVLYEDFGHGFDVTSDIALPKDLTAKVTLTARESFPVAGIEFALAALRIIDPQIEINCHVTDGDIAKKGQGLVDMSGSARKIMSAERTALNFLGHMSGIALQTSFYAKKIAYTNAKVTCTRKTLPLLRMIQKYAVRVGGGFSHRSGLDDAILIKDNHIAACGSIAKTLEHIRHSIGHTTKIEIECDTLTQVDEALSAGADIIMLDNMNHDQLKQAVNMASGKVILEASGGVTLDTIEDIANTGVDMISVGALTHTVSYADVAFDM